MKSYKLRAKLIDTKFVSVWVDAETEEEAIDSLGTDDFNWDDVKDEDYYTHEFEDIKVETERDMEPCQFCKEYDLIMNGHYHQNDFVCHKCWDERLRSTE